jgi:hypothetical protein
MLKTIILCHDACYNKMLQNSRDIPEKKEFNLSNQLKIKADTKTRGKVHTFSKCILSEVMASFTLHPICLFTQGMR